MYHPIAQARAFAFGLTAMSFTGYVQLRHREVHPPLEDMPDYLHKACLRQTSPFVGQFEATKDDSKLATNDNHLNDHVYHIHYSTASPQKHVIFTIGITDYDKRKSCRIFGNDHAYVQTRQDRWKTSVAIAEAALDLWEAAREVNMGNVHHTVPPMPRTPRPCPAAEAVLHTLAAFSGAEYGNFYLSFDAGEALVLSPPPPGVLSEGWSFGRKRNGECGWFPPEYAR